MPTTIGKQVLLSSETWRAEFWRHHTASLVYIGPNVFFSFQRTMIQPENSEVLDSQKVIGSFMQLIAKHLKHDRSNEICAIALVALKMCVVESDQIVRSFRKWLTDDVLSTSDYDEVLGLERELLRLTKRIVH